MRHKLVDYRESFQQIVDKECRERKRAQMFATVFAVAFVAATGVGIGLAVHSSVAGSQLTEVVVARDKALRERNDERVGRRGLTEQMIELEERAKAVEASAADYSRRLLYAEQEVLRYEDALDAAASTLSACKSNADAAAYRCGWWKRDRDACYCHVYGSECDPVTVDWGGAR